MTVQIARKLFSVSDYARMRESGILAEDDRVELIGGEVRSKTSDTCHLTSDLSHLRASVIIRALRVHRHSIAAPREGTWLNWVLSRLSYMVICHTAARRVIGLMVRTGFTKRLRRRISPY